MKKSKLVVFFGLFSIIPGSYISLHHKVMASDTDINTEEAKNYTVGFIGRVVTALRNNTIGKVIDGELGQQSKTVKDSVKQMLQAAFAKYNNITSEEIQVLRIVTQGLPQGVFQAPLKILGEPGVLKLEFKKNGPKFELSDVFIGDRSQAQALGIKK